MPGQHIGRSAVEQECQKAHGICKISKPITPHSMRHAFAVHLLEQGTDVRTIQLLLGHRSLETTARYLRIATSKVCSRSSPLDLLPHPIPVESEAHGAPETGSGGYLPPLRRSLSRQTWRGDVHGARARPSPPPRAPHST